MNELSLSAVLMRLRLAWSALGPVAGASALLCLAAAGALLWLLPQRSLQVQRHQVALAIAARPQPVVKEAPQSANENLALFYDTLGERRYAEQQVKTLFGLAAKTGLVLSQGEYKSAYDQNAGIHTYQVNLPVKGSYAAIWRFSMLALGAVPFASLDEISFKRDAIGEPGVDARLRLTFYLADLPGAAP